MHEIKADGSDRLFKRTMYNNQSAVTIHPSQTPTGLYEARSFYDIGTYLFEKGIPVAKIYNFDPSSGVVIVEDLGDELFFHRAQRLKKGKEERELILLYKRALEVLDLFQDKGSTGFDTEWCFDTPVYDADFAFKREALYFTDAFLREACGIDPDDALISELSGLCKRVESFKSRKCLMHRDFQSRNLMIKNDAIKIIDFQGARLGPWGYDPASLIYDPYMDLPEEMRDKLVLFFINLHNQRNRNTCDLSCLLEEFYTTALLRTMQALGAYGFLTQKRRRDFFRPFIKPALSNLVLLVKMKYFPELVQLRKLAENLNTSF